LKFFSAKICSKFFSESLVEIFHAQSGREISRQAPPIPAEARGLAGAGVVVQPVARVRGPFGRIVSGAGSGRSLTGAFGRVDNQGKGWGWADWK